MPDTPPLFRQENERLREQLRQQGIASVQSGTELEFVLPEKPASDHWLTVRKEIEDSLQHQIESAAPAEKEALSHKLDSVRDFNAREVMMYDLIERDPRTRDILEPAFGTSGQSGYYDAPGTLELKTRPVDESQLRGHLDTVAAVIKEKSKEYGFSPELIDNANVHVSYSFHDEKGNIFSAQTQSPEKMQRIAAGTGYVLKDMAPYVLDPFSSGISADIGADRGKMIRLAPDRMEIRYNEELAHFNPDALTMSVMAGAQYGLDPKNNASFEANALSSTQIVQSPQIDNAGGSSKVFQHILEGSTIGTDGYLVPPEHYINNPSSGAAPKASRELGMEFLRHNDINLSVLSPQQRELVVTSGMTSDAMIDIVRRTKVVPKSEGGFELAFPTTKRLGGEEFPLDLSAQSRDFSVPALRTAVAGKIEAHPQASHSERYQEILLSNEAFTQVFSPQLQEALAGKDAADRLFSLEKTRISLGPELQRTIEQKAAAGQMVRAFGQPAAFTGSQEELAQLQSQLDGAGVRTNYLTTSDGKPVLSINLRYDHIRAIMPPGVDLDKIDIIKMRPQPGFDAPERSWHGNASSVPSDSAHTAPPEHQAATSLGPLGIDYASVHKRYPEASQMLTAVLDNNDSLYLNNLNPRSEPARDFEAQSGMRNISAHYHLPPGQIPSELEFSLNRRQKMAENLEDILEQNHVDLFFPQGAMRVPVVPGTSLHDAISDAASLTNSNNIGLFNRHLDQLVSFNPELGELHVDRQNPRSVVDAINGTTSGFNINDQNHFLSGAAFNDRPQMEAQNLYEYGVHWVPSPSTLDNIASQMPPEKLLDLVASHPDTVRFDRRTGDAIINVSEAGYPWLADKASAMGTLSGDGSVTLGPEYSDRLRESLQRHYRDATSNESHVPVTSGATITPQDAIRLREMSVATEPSIEGQNVKPASQDVPANHIVPELSSEQSRHIISTPTADGALGHASSIYMAAVQGRQGVEDIFQHHTVGAVVNLSSAAVGGAEFFGHATNNEKLLNALGSKGEALGVAADLYNAGMNFSEGRDAGVATDLAARSLVKAGENRAVMAVGNEVASTLSGGAISATGGLVAGSLLTMVDTGAQNNETLNSAKEKIDAINVGTDTFRHLRESVVMLENEKDPSTGKPLLSGLAMHDVPATENGRPVIKDGKHVTSQQIDWANPANREKIHAALDRERILLLETMHDNADRVAIAVPLIGNVTDSTSSSINDTIAKAEGATGISDRVAFALPLVAQIKEASAAASWATHRLDGLTGNNLLLKDPEAVALYANADIQRKQIEVSMTELGLLSDKFNFVDSAHTKSPAQAHDDAETARRIDAVPIKTNQFILERGNYWKSDNFIPFGDADHKEPLPPAAIKAYKADPAHNRVYEEVLYRRDSQGNPLLDAQGKPVPGEIKRWEIIDPQGQRQSDLHMTSKEQQGTFGSTWQVEWRTNANEKKDTLHKQFDAAAEAYKANNSESTQAHLVEAYQNYRNQLKYLKENAQTLGLDKDAVKVVDTSMAQAVGEFNQAFDRKLQELKEANAQFHSAHIMAPNLSQNHAGKSGRA